MKILLISETTADTQRRIQKRALRSTFIMIVAMLAIPILLSACGKSEWREVKAPEATLEAKPDTAANVATSPSPSPAVSPAPAPSTATAPEKKPVVKTPPVKKAPAKSPPVKVAVTPSRPAQEIKPAQVSVNKPVPTKPADTSSLPTSTASEADRFIMIQNIATEKIARLRALGCCGRTKSSCVRNEFDRR